VHVLISADMEGGTGTVLPPDGLCIPGIESAGRHTVRYHAHDARGRCGCSGSS